MANWIPPGGFAGFAQSTPAMVQNARNVARGLTGGGGKKKRRKSRKKKAAGATRRASSRRRSSKRKVLKKGSAAAKRYMAKIRKMRKR